MATKSEEELGCKQSGNLYRNGDFWRLEQEFYACVEGVVMMIMESCEEISEKQPCITVEALNAQGASIENFAELADLPELGSSGVLGRLVEKPDNAKQTLNGVCNDGESKLEPIKYGKADYECVEEKWQLSNVNCQKSTNKYDYIQKSDKCERKDISECKKSDTKKKDIKYGKTQYKCADHKWKLDKVTCDKDTRQYSFKVKGNKCERKDISDCKKGDDKKEDIKYGKIQYKCSDFRWKIDKVTCDKDTSRYDYYKKDNACKRKDISECSGGKRKTKDIQYGKAEYKCSNYKWKLDKVRCDKDSDSYKYKRVGDKCKRESKGDDSGSGAGRSCTKWITKWGRGEAMVILHGEKKKRSIENGTVTHMCDNGKYDYEIDCRIGYRERSDKCIR